MKAFVKKDKREIDVYATVNPKSGEVEYYDKNHPEDIYLERELIFKEYYGN